MGKNSLHGEHASLEVNLTVAAACLKAQHHFEFVKSYQTEHDSQIGSGHW